MAEAKYDSELYEYTKSQINMVLPMEWTIRAIQKLAPDQYQALKSLDAKLHKFWRKKEFSDNEIIAFGLTGW